MTKRSDDRYLDSETFIAEAPRKEGSWWPEWLAWLDARSGALIAPPAFGDLPPSYASLGDAPGTYVFQE
jgi:polyhydroxyalkanoate synthase